MLITLCNEVLTLSHPDIRNEHQPQQHADAGSKRLSKTGRAQTTREGLAMKRPPYCASKQKDSAKQARHKLEG
jgi:hypothetical protein